MEKNSTDIKRPPEGLIDHCSANLPLKNMRQVRMNCDTDYARSFGIEKEDLLFLDQVGAHDGDLVLVSIDGQHELDTYNHGLTREHLGVIVASLRFYDSAFDATDDFWPEEIDFDGGAK